MLVMAGLGSYIALGEPKASSAAVGILTLYFVLTGWRAAGRRQSSATPIDFALAGIGLCLVSILIALGCKAFTNPGGTLDKAPFAAFFIFAAIAGLGAGLDVKVLVAGGMSARQRLVRHLWRMSVAFFFSASFFFLGQQQVMPVFMQGSPVLFIPAFAPLALLAYWLIAWGVPKRAVGAAPEA